MSGVTGPEGGGPDREGSVDTDPSWGDGAGGQPSGGFDGGQGSDRGQDVDGGFDVEDVPEPPTTGDPAVDESLRRVAGAMSASLPEQAQAYDAVHRALQDRLADVED